MRLEMLRFVYRLLDLPQLRADLYGFADRLEVAAPGMQRRLVSLDACPLMEEEARIISCRLGTVGWDACDQTFGKAYHFRLRDMAKQSEITCCSWQQAVGDSRCLRFAEARTIGRDLLRDLQKQSNKERTKSSKFLDWLWTVATKMAPRGRPTRLNPGTTPPPVTDTHTTTSVTSAQLQAMIDEGVTAVLAARATTRNGDDSHTSGTGGHRRSGRLDTNGLTRMEIVFRISNCTVENQVKFATCTLMGIALTWWNSHVRTVTNDVAKVEAELWNLKVQGTDVVTYNQRFQELALLSDRMFPEETDKIERYVGGMPDPIYSSVVASKPKTMQEAIEMATELMDRRNNTLAERQAENKRKFEDTPRNNQTQQPNKRQNTGRAYAAGNGDRKPYEGAKPRCPKCNFNHYGPCTPKCTNCKKLGHLAKDCRS
ncbi:reverse transcriptase domain-containing protein [Tanacetum coccineum]|uniref:Reverse transcriptase domain-containing protein n=1 Tax=Tanacetum coccineum TaxID=301880 RepID=A0ABQ5IEM6_9ASTR